MEDLQSRGAPLEYWFVKVSCGDLAFLADWIVRRDSGSAEVRISMWVRGTGRVLRSRSRTWREDGTAVEICGCTLTARGATGEVESVRWNLACLPGPWLLEPAPVFARLSQPFDLQLVARPRARFDGTVTVGKETFRIDDAAGTLVHYWGRRLPHAWLWVSADGVGEHDAAVEAALFRSRLWGASKPLVAGGYVAVNALGRTAQIIAPVYGRITAAGNRTAFDVRARTFGQSIDLTARAPQASYNDLGEGIRQTLLADLTVDGWGSCSGRAGLEIRGGPAHGRAPHTTWQHELTSMVMVSASSTKPSCPANKSAKSVSRLLSKEPIRRATHPSLPADPHRCSAGTPVSSPFGVSGPTDQVRAHCRLPCGCHR